jgi:hypothetical protein
VGRATRLQQALYRPRPRSRPRSSTLSTARQGDLEREPQGRWQQGRGLHRGGAELLGNARQDLLHRLGGGFHLQHGRRDAPDLRPELLQTGPDPTGRLDGAGGDLLGLAVVAQLDAELRPCVESFGALPIGA